MAKSGLHAVPFGTRGTVVVITPDVGKVDITPFRADGTYSDGRRPDTVRFGVSLEEDLKRRDLTINAMAEDDYGEVIDLHEGCFDLKRRCIRAVGDPLTRFKEDGLRPIRAARFAAYFDGSWIDGQTLYAMETVDARKRVAVVSRERLHDEIMMAMAAPAPWRFWEVLRDTRLIDFVVPEMNLTYGLPQPTHHHLYDVWKHSIETLKEVAKQTNDPLQRLAAFLHDIGKTRTLTLRESDNEPQFLEHEIVGRDMVNDILARLKFSKDENRRVAEIVRHHMIFYEPSWSRGAVMRWMRRVGGDDQSVEDLIIQRRADLIAHGIHSRRHTEFEEFVSRVREIQEGSKLPRLVVNGRDLMDEAGFKPGSRLGRTLRHLEEHILDHPEDNIKERLLELARKV